MKTASQFELQHPAFLKLQAPSRRESRLSQACELGWDFVVEVYETIAGIFAMPLQRLQYDHSVDPLNEHLLRDIGQERTKALGPDSESDSQ